MHCEHIVSLLCIIDSHRIIKPPGFAHVTSQATEQPRRDTYPKKGHEHFV